MSDESFRLRRSFVGTGSFLVSVVLLSFSSGAAWCQVDGAPPGALAGTASAATGFPMLRVGPTEIPLGSSEIRTAGETPAILRPSGALRSARNRAGASGIPLGAVELVNPGLSFSPQTVTPKGCTARAGATGSVGALPHAIIRWQCRKIRGLWPWRLEPFSGHRLKHGAAGHCDPEQDGHGLEQSNSQTAVLQASANGPRAVRTDLEPVRGSNAPQNSDPRRPCYSRRRCRLPVSE